jgi:hypothetical protein
VGCDRALTRLSRSSRSTFARRFDGRCRVSANHRRLTSAHSADVRPKSLDDCVSTLHDPVALDPMMSVLSRQTGRLLRTVNGKRHASDEDHEEPPAKRRKSPAAPIAQSEEDIYAEPVSSDDELRDPPPPKPKVALPITTVSDETDELNLPQRKPAKKEADTHATSQGSAKKTRAAKGKKGQEEDKENTTKAIPHTSSQGEPWDFGMAHASQRSNKSTTTRTFSTKNKTANIHAKTAIRVPPRQSSKPAAKAKAPLDNDADLSDVSMVGPEELEHTLGLQGKPDPELRERVPKKRSKRGIEPITSTLADDELNILLKSTPEDADLKRASRRSQTTALYDQLGDWKKDHLPESSQPESSAPQDDVNDLREYLKQHPREAVEGSECPICRAPVESEYYWEYWAGTEKTIKNQNKFCHAHRTTSAWEEYRSEGYPDIIWEALPQRIRKHRMELYKILNNDRPSVYRDRYEPIALTGKAAAVPSRRKDLPSHVLQELESYVLDDQSTFPGYYGPHGRRVITETVMKMLKNEIKNCLDAVVQGSGPATFVQAVLVPETAILLIMEDNRVDREEAEEIREKTYDIGMLLNEEIEDRVEVHEQSDDENEYGGS